MFERILLPLDGSPLAEAVLSHVSSILRRQDSEVFLLRASAPAVTAPGPVSPFIAEDRGIAESYVNDLARRLIEEGIRVRAIVESGPTASTILDVAQREGIEIPTACWWSA